MRAVTDTEFSDQIILSRAEASRGRTLQAIASERYYVRIRYGADGGVWGPAQVIPVDVDAASALSLSSFAVISTSQTAGSYTLPGFSASWDALAGDDLQRTRSIAVQYRLNGTTNVTTLYVEADETGKAVAGLIAGATYNVRARAEDVYGGGSWTAWANVTVSATWTVGGATSVGWSGVSDDDGNRPEPNATLGATWGNNVGSIPANLSSLTGSEGILNTAVSIAANGTLSGAGGGQVTLSGVGFTGDTNATYGAAWGSTVTGRPTELTDGRVAAGLDALGDLNRNISSARLDSSNALRRTGGGLFSGALNANYITNTNELTDGAALGTTAAWASISSRPAELTDGRITSALNASGILQTAIPNASQIPTLTLSKVSDAGTLAGKSTVAQAEISSGYSLIESGAGTPTATSRRIYEDTTNDVIWYDDGTDIRRISREALTDNLGSNTGFSGAAYKVVVAIEVPGLKELDLLSIQTLQSNFQGPNEATNENVVGEWAIGIVDASRAPGDAWAGTGTENIIADGRTINFQLDGSDVVVNGNGIEGLILDVGGYRIPVAYEGTCYLCLLLRLTSFTSDQILLAGTGTQMRILISP
jgi:hypothetical protein